MSCTLRVVDNLTCLGTDEHLLRVHLVFCKVFHLNVVEVAKTAMEGDVCEVDAANLHALHKLTREVESCGRSRNGAFVLGEDALEVVEVFLSAVRIVAAVDDVSWERSLAERIKLALELVMRTVVEESQRTSAAGGVVDDLSHHCSRLVEEELVTDTYLSCRLDENVPKTHLFVQLAQEEHLNLGVCLLLRAIETCREHLRVVEDKGVVLVKIVEDVAEVKEFALNRIAVSVLLIHVDGLRLLMEHHESAFVAACDAECLLLAVVVFELTVYAMRIECYLLFWQLKLEL